MFKQNIAFDDNFPTIQKIYRDRSFKVYLEFATISFKCILLYVKLFLVNTKDFYFNFNYFGSGIIFGSGSAALFMHFSQDWILEIAQKRIYWSLFCGLGRAYVNSTWQKYFHWNTIALKVVRSLAAVFQQYQSESAL